MGKFFGNKKKNTSNSVGNVKTETIIDQNGDISIVSKNFTITTNQAKKETSSTVSPSWTCWGCGRVTTEDPCPVCGKKRIR